MSETCYFQQMIKNKVYVVHLLVTVVFDAVCGQLIVSSVCGFAVHVRVCPVTLVITPTGLLLLQKAVTDSVSYTHLTLPTIYSV